VKEPLALRASRAARARPSRPVSVDPVHAAVYGTTPATVGGWGDSGGVRAMTNEQILASINHPGATGGSIHYRRR
jgi:hypothetical protein